MALATYFQHSDEFRCRYAHPVPVTAVYHINDGICVSVVTPPIGPSVECRYCNTELEHKQAQQT